MKMNENHQPCIPAEPAALCRIGLFSQMGRLSVKALHFYEEQGLLLPAAVDPENGYRYYSMDQLPVLRRITVLKEAGFTLEEIKTLNAAPDKERCLLKKRADLLSKIAELTAQVARIDGFLSDQGSSLTDPILIRTIPAVTVACMESRIDSYDALFDLMPEMGAEMERLGLRCAVPDDCFTLYPEPEYKEEQIAVLTCQAITGERRDSGCLRCIELPEVTAACLFHRGSYAGFPESYARLLRYIEENGYEICAPIREQYIDGIWNKTSEADWLSEIRIPVRKREA